MELSSNEEGEIALPINSTYVGAHMIHHHHHHQMNNNAMIPSSVPQIPTSNGPLDASPKKPQVKYRECLKNHAASMGGNATDGCGEFMPSGDDGTLEALTCSACNCHRNFHRKETESDTSSPSPFDHYFNRPRKLLLGHPKSALGADYPTAAFVPPRGGAGPPHHHHHMIMSYNVGSDQSDEQEDGGGVVIARPMHQMARKRFRTKFSVEQKEKMLHFAEKVGWKIQKQEESVVQQFCQEIGVKRRVLKVWMHNNKHNLAKKMINIDNHDNNNHNHNHNHNPSLSLPTATAATTATH